MMKDAESYGECRQQGHGYWRELQIAPCMERLTEVLEAGAQIQGAVAKVRLENFGAFNDTFGFGFGNRLIGEIAGFLHTVAGGEAYHTSGVEFVLLLEGLDPAAAQKVLTEMLQRFEQSWRIDAMDCVCTVHVGAVYYPGVAHNAVELLEQLSHAVCASEQAGQNSIAVYDQELANKILRRSIIAQQIPGAMEEDAVEIRYRPSFGVEEGRYARADCYMRMFTEEYGFVHAAELIPIAEESGQIYTISHYAIQKACALIAGLIAAGKAFESIAVPISPIQLLQESFVSCVTQAIHQAGIPAHRLAFEVLESAALRNFPRARICLGELSALGIEIVLTSFGTGDFSLCDVLELPVDAVKLDRSLIWRIEGDSPSAMLAEGLIHIAKNLGLKAIAEGVETQRQADLLESYDCDYEQGFFYSTTMTAEELTELLQTQ